MPYSIITKQALAMSMKQLMRQRDFSRITVGDICAACGMNRKSFYYHFKDKYELVNWIFHEEFVIHMQAEKYGSSWELFEDLCRYFYREREFYENALSVEGQNSFREYALETILPVAETFIKDMFQKNEHHDFFVVFFSEAFLAAILRWLKDSEKMSIEDFLERLHSILILLAEKVVEESKK